MSADTLARALALSAGRTATLGSIPGMFNNDRTFLNKWAAGKGDVRLGDANALMMCVGDSITHGWADGSSGLFRNAYPTQLARMLTTLGIPAESDSWFGTGGEANPAAVATYDPRLSIGAGWVYSTTISVGGVGLANISTTNALTFTPEFAWDTVELWTVGASGGTTPFTLDVGGAPTALATVQNTVSRQTATFPKAVQALNLMRAAPTGNNLAIIGMHCYDSTTKRVAVFNFGRAGWTSADWNDASNAARPKSMLTTIGTGAMGGVRASSIFSLGINDRGGGGAGAIGTPAYNTNCQALITTMKAVGDVMAFIPPPSATGTTSQPIQDEYDNVLRALCYANGCAYIDLPKGWAYYVGAVAAGFSGSNAIHPAKRGYDNLAQQLARAFYAA